MIECAILSDMARWLSSAKVGQAGWKISYFSVRSNSYRIDGLEFLQGDSSG